MRPFSIFPLILFLFIPGILVSIVILPIDYTYDETCPRCQGKGVVTCETCHGDGKCWICGGTGKIWYMPESDNLCAACQGTGICYTCEGLGSHSCGECGGAGLLIHWMFTPTGFTTVLSITGIFLFLGFFVLNGFFTALHLSFNQWIYEVEDMGFWFNPSFMTWLFAKYRRRWAKWQTGLGLLFAIYFGDLLFWIFSLKNMSRETFAIGTLFSVGIVGLFSFIFYRSYAAGIKTSL